MNLLKLNKPDYYFYFIVWILFYILNRFSPFTGDDYWYKFIFDVDLDKFRPILSIEDAIHSQVIAYMEKNGRFIVHSLTAYFCGVLGVSLFRICNSVIFVLMLAGIVKLLRLECGFHKSDKYLVLVLLIIFMPYPGQIFLGTIAMCINYLWTACSIIYLMILYRQLEVGKSSYNWIGKLFIGALAFIVGSLQESFTIAISAAFFIYYCFHKKRFSGNVRWMVIGFWAGTAVVTLAPGNFVRLDAVNSVELFSGGMKYISNFCYVFFQTKLLIIIILILTVLMFKNKNAFKEFCRTNSLYFMIIFFDILLASVVYSGERQLTCIELFSLIILMKLWYIFIKPWISPNYEVILTTILCVGLCIVYIPVYRYRAYAFKAYEYLNHCKVTDAVLENCNFQSDMRFLKSNYLSRRYTYNLEFEDWVYWGYSVFRTNGEDSRYVSALLPASIETMLERYTKYNKDGIYFDDKNYIYLFRAPVNNPINKCYVLSEPLSSFGKIRNWLFKKEQTLKIDVTEKLGFFSNAGYIYYVLYQSDYKVLGLSIQ